MFVQSDVSILKNIFNILCIKKGILLKEKRIDFDTNHLVLLKKILKLLNISVWKSIREKSIEYNKNWPYFTYLTHLNAELIGNKNIKQNQ